jgi:TetR/AcrR family transcriptional repressor of nem operon
MAILSTMVGAVLLSRAVNDERLSKRFLQAAAESVLMGSSAGDGPEGPRQ